MPLLLVPTASSALRLRAATAIVLSLAVFAILQSCSHVPDNVVEINSNIDVFGVELYSRIDHQVLDGETSQREPCTLGYEYSFEQLDVTIGYTHQGFVRLIKTRNLSTSIFGVSPGKPLAEANLQLGGYRFSPVEAPNVFRRGSIEVNLLTNEHDVVFGVSAQALLYE